MGAPLHLVRQRHAMQQQKQVWPVGPVPTIHVWQMLLQVPHVGHAVILVVYDV